MFHRLVRGTEGSNGFRVWPFILGHWWLWCVSPASASPEGPLVEKIREGLRNRIEAAAAGSLDVGSEPIYASVVLPRFYQNRVFEPAWIEEGAQTRLRALVEAIGKVRDHGLDPKHYHIGELATLIREVEKPRAKRESTRVGTWVDLELLATDAYLICASHLLAGRIDPVSIDPEWHADRPDLDLAQHLQNALKNKDLWSGLDELLPRHQQYELLRQAYLKFRAFAGDKTWPPIAAGPTLQLGDSAPRVVQLRTRLQLSFSGQPQSEQVPVPTDSDRFDTELVAAVKLFQKHHGLDTDGKVGPKTLEALNVPLKDRVRQLELNLERWRWLPQDLGNRYILVNIAGFELSMIEEGKTALEMEVVVGRDYRRTPVLSAKMTYLVLAPYWHIPPKLAVEDKLPIIRKNREYFQEQHIRIFSGWGTEAKELDPGEVDWSKVFGRNFNFRFRQDPGPWNALGRVKFMFPNAFNVYLHDTPQPELFGKTERAFSSGCVRVSQPLALAERLLADDPKWTPESIRAAIDTNVERTISLKRPIMVHLLYWTAWAEEGGGIQLRPDIYGRDRLLDAALREAPPP